VLIAGKTRMLILSLSFTVKKEMQQTFVHWKLR